MPGFAFGEYDINEGLKDLLETTASALIKDRTEWEMYNLNVRVAGYTDPALIRKGGIALNIDKTGIDNWSNIENQLDVYYGECPNDNLSDNMPVYINFMSSAGEKVGLKIKNNCELGAVRAYVATVYLITKPLCTESAEVFRGLKVLLTQV